MKQKIACFSILIGLSLATGCAVPQPRGEGHYQRIKEPYTKAHYNLYLPVDYVKNKGVHPNPKIKKWPLVMTFHGMKPYDNALPQEREWEQQADLYGYIVCAPELSTSDSFMEYPLTKEHDYVLEDRRNVLAIMDHIFATTNADPHKVLSTSWSCGGYLAHYFPNRHPDRFACIATRLSNFSSSLMIENTVPMYKDKVPVAVFIGDGDFPACKSESEEAVAWYTARGFRVIRGKMIDSMGHQRIPQTAAAFFAEQLGIEPLNRPEAARSLTEVHMTEYYPPQELIAKYSPPSGLLYASRSSPVNTPLPLAQTVPQRSAPQQQTPAVPPATVQQPPRTLAYSNVTAGSKYPSNRRPVYDPNPPAEAPKQVSPDASRTAAKPPPSAPPSEPAKLAYADRPRPASTPPKSSSTAQRSALTPKPVPQQKPTKPEVSRTEPAQNSRSRSVAPSPSQIASSMKLEKKPAPIQQPRNSPPSKTPQLAAATKNNARNTRDTAPTRKPPASFSPQNAGRRDALASSRARSGTEQRRTSVAPDTKSVSLSSIPASTTPVRTVSQGRANRVNIKLSGPSIGTAPHYLAYSADLPRSATDGADFLWMDNGVWIGDDPRGVKILETPGLHRITVLIVTRDEKEYRGQATVQVLDPGPTASAYSPRQR